MLINVIIPTHHSWGVEDCLYNGVDGDEGNFGFSLLVFAVVARCVIAISGGCEKNRNLSVFFATGAVGPISSG